MQHSTTLERPFLRMSDLATTAERPAKTYQDKNGKLRNIKGKPAKCGLLPMGESTIWGKVKDGSFPQPFKLSERITAWRTEDIQDYILSKTNN